MCFDIGVVTCGPNEALVISGVFYGTRPCIIVGGRAVVCPCVQRVQRIPLTTLTLIIDSPRVYTSQGVPISVTGVAQVCNIGANTFAYSYSKPPLSFIDLSSKAYFNFVHCIRWNFRLIYVGHKCINDISYCCSTQK